MHGCINALTNFVVVLYTQRNRCLCFDGLPLAEVDGQQARLCVCVFSRVYCLQNTTASWCEALIRLESSSMATWRPACLSPSLLHSPILRHSNRSHPACCNLPLFQRVKCLVIVQGMSRWQADPGADGIRALTSRRPICPL